MNNTAPTLGFNVETVAYKNIEFMVWDMGGQDAIRPLWRHYYANAQALIFVVDSADEAPLSAARGARCAMRPGGLGALDLQVEVAELLPAPQLRVLLRLTLVLRCSTSNSMRRIVEIYGYYFPKEDEWKRSMVRSVSYTHLRAHET